MVQYRVLLLPDTTFTFITLKIAAATQTKKTTAMALKILPRVQVSIDSM